MKKHSYIVFVDILLLIGVVYLFSMCANGNNDNNISHSTYNINHYIDTVYGHVILTTVCNSKYYENNVSVSTFEIDNFSKIDNN